MHPLDVVLSVVFCVLFLAAIGLSFRSGSRVTVGTLVGGGLVVVAVVVLPLESLEWSPDGGIRVQTRGPRMRNVEISVHSVAEGIDTEQLHVFLVPVQHKAVTQTRSGDTFFSFENVPEGAYNVLLADRAGHFLLEPRTVAGDPTLDSIDRFPRGINVSGEVRELTGRPLANVAVGLGDNVAWTRADGSSGIEGAQSGERQLRILGRAQSLEPIELGSEDVDAGVLYWPDPVRDAQFCEEIQVTEDSEGEKRWVLVDPSQTFSPDVERVYFYTRVVGATAPTQIIHRWIHDDTPVDVPLDIESNDYRTNSSRQIDRKQGEWKVQVLSKSGDILATRAFWVGE